MATITLETTATVPVGESLSVTVEEDSTGDGTVDVSATQSIADGTNSYTLSGFDATAGNQYRIKPEATLSAMTGTVELHSATTTVPTDAAVAGTASSSTSAAGSVATHGTTGGTAAAAMTATGAVSSVGKAGTSTATMSATGAVPSVGTRGTAGATTTASATWGNAAGVHSASAHATTAATGTRVGTGPGMGTAAVTTTASGTYAAEDLTPTSTQTLWRLFRQPGGETEADLFDIQTTEAVNRYASHFVARIDDPAGTKSSDYPRGQRALAQYSTDGGTTWNTKQAGFVNYFNDTGRGGTDQLEVLFVGYDHFLRRRPVFETFTGVTVSSALQTLVTEHTPVNWNAANVTVANDVTLTREIQGEKADEVLSSLSSLSGGEEYGVTDDFEFYFRPRETETAPSNILNGDWFEYDLPEEGRPAVNQARVFYGQAGARSSVIVEDRVSQLELKDKLGAPRRVVLSKEVAYPEIDNEDAAAAKGREILEGRSPIRKGSVKTFERYDWEPGDVFRLEIPSKDINTTFRAAEINHHWARGETTMKIAENEGNVSDLLVGMSDEIERIDFREADPDATFARFLELGIGATVSIAGTFSQRTTENAFNAGFGPTGNQAGFVNTAEGNPQPGLVFGDRDAPAGTGAATTAALNQFRDAWTGDTPAEITEFALGTGGSKPTQTDTALEAEVHRGLVDSVNALGSHQITFEASVPPGGALEGEQIQEFGFLDSAGNLHGRTVLDEYVTHTDTTETTVTMTFTVDTDTSRQGVVTDTGQTRLRDMYLDHANSTNHHPTDRAYGTGTTAEAEADTALGMKVGESPITEFADGSAGTTDVVMRLGTTEANGNAISEFGDENAANELLTRATFEAIDKTSNFALETTTNFSIRPVIL